MTHSRIRPTYIVAYRQSAGAGKPRRLRVLGRIVTRAGADVLAAQRLAHKVWPRVGDFLHVVPDLYAPAHLANQLRHATAVYNYRGDQIA